MAEAPLHEQIAQRALQYLSAPRGENVLELASPDELAQIFDQTVGLDLENGESHSDAAVLEAVDQVLRYSVHTSHPLFMNQNFAGADPLAVAGDWLGAALNTTAATYEAAPVFTLMERAVLRRLARIIGFPAPVGAEPPGLFCAGGSLASLMALQLARHRIDPQIVAHGMSSQRFAVFVSESSHYSIEKNAAVLGIGSGAVVKVRTTHSGAMDTESLATEIKRAREQGATPLAVVATSGTTVTGAFDPLGPIADLCAGEDIWMHVDACYGGSALFSDDQRWRLEGIEKADSVVWNLHKMMGMTQQCTVLLVREPSGLQACFATGADYLFQPDKLYGDLDAGDNTIMCARRVDVLKLWLAWKSHGDMGFGARVDHAVGLADHARQSIARGALGLRAIVAGDFTNVCFLWSPPHLRSTPITDLDADAQQRLHSLPPRVKARMQREGKMMLSYQPVNGINAFRLIVMNPEVQVADVDLVLATVARYSEELW
ncbi:MAG: pyridoxal phosphate-dependent decarboxylase family protein [Acidimicrobiales bacterium]